MSQVPLANWNGKLAPLDQINVPVLDRGFLFGDGVYEAMRIYAGQVFLLDEHWARLARSLRELSLEADLDRLRRRLTDTLVHSGVQDGLIYLQITRGAGPRRTHAFPRPAGPPNELIWIEGYASADPMAENRERGVEAVTFPDWRWGRRDIKSINLLANCLAAEHAKKAGAFEAILIDPTGHFTEGSHTSLFGIRDGVLFTYPSGPEILPGCTRAFLLRLAGQIGLTVETTPLSENDLPNIDELFLTGTTSEVIGIVKVDGKLISTGRVGPITRRLSDAYHQEVRRWLTTCSTMT
ncbi:aminotransferase class IV [bacterium]|nr:aminotransferase class IV [bacterium]